MNGFVILVIVLLLAGIILLSGPSKLDKRTREEYLKDLTKFLEGTLEPIEDELISNSFRIRFKFSNEDFIFEDWERKGFKEKIYSAYLIVKTSNRLTLKFSEKERSTKVRTDIFIASDVSSQEISRTTHLQLPKHLKDLNVSTNDTTAANELLDEGKISSILKQFKSKDSRGYSFMPLKIVDGTVTLEFYSDKILKPNLVALYSDISSIDGYLKKMMVFVRELKK